MTAIRTFAGDVSLPCEPWERPTPRPAAEVVDFPPGISRKKVKPGLRCDLPAEGTNFRRVYDFVRENPGCTSQEVGDGIGRFGRDCSAALSSLRRRGFLKSASRVRYQTWSAVNLPK